MAKAYVEKLSLLMKRAVPEDIKGVELEIKHFFSGAAVYASGKICVTLTPVGFALKLPEKYRDEIISKEGARPLQYFPQGPIKKEYALLPGSILNDNDALGFWVRRSVEYVTSNLQ